MMEGVALSMGQDATRQAFLELSRRTVRAARVWKGRAASVGALRLLTVCLAALGLEIALDALFVLPAPTRLIWIIGVLVFAIIACFWWIVRPVVRSLDPVKVAAHIEASFPELGEDLESSLELWSKRGQGRERYSVELIDAVIAKAVEESAGLRFAAGVSVGSARRWVGGFAGVAAAIVALGLGVSERVGPALNRMIHPIAALEGPVVTIEVEPGDTTIVAGEDLAVRATVKCGGAGSGVREVALDYEVAGEARAERQMVRDGADPNAYRFTVHDLRADVVYSVSAEGITSADYVARVIEPPFVTGIALVYRYPEYTGLLPRSVDENNGDITALRGTQVTLTVRVSKPLEAARLVLEGGVERPLEAVGPKAYETTVTVDRSADYSIEILDLDGLVNPAPPAYSIVALSDEYPLVRIVEPGEDRELPRGMVLPLLVSAIDDYGISNIAIRYSMEGMAEEGVARIGGAGPRSEREVVKEVEWDLSGTGIMPGTVMVYFAEAVDNDAVTGPKTARSESYLVRFPSMAELYRDVTGEHDEITEDLEDIAERQEEIREEFQEIDEALKSEPEIDWQDEERIEEALKHQEELTQDVEELADRMSDLTEKMSETDRVTLETLEKMEELTRLLDEVASDEMRELIEQIKEAMEKISPEEVSLAMEEMTMTQEDYLRRLEQTINLLKRVRAEQMVADLANRAEDLAERQGSVAEESERSPGKESCEKLAEQQKRLAEEAGDLRDDLERAAAEMRELGSDAAGDVQEAASEMDTADTLEKMKGASEQLAEGQPAKAAPQCQSAAKDLFALFHRLSECQGGMACSMRAQSREAVLRAVDALLGVSGEQEEILVAVEGRRRIPRAELVELVAKQTDLTEALSGIVERMFKVSKESFVIDPGVYRAFGVVELAMTRAATRIAGGGTAAGQKEAKEALGKLNALIVKFLSANMSMSPSGGSGSLQQLMDQLRRMAEQQAELNLATEDLKRRMEEMGMGSETQRQLAQIKGHQEGVRDQARRLAEEIGERGEILGRLEDTIEEIDETLAAMEEVGVSQETIDRQKKILSRLLDAQRSLRRRDYTRERRSRAGRAYVRTGPDELPESAVRAGDELREDLLRAMQRDYPEEYRELIRAYFLELSRDAAAGGGPVQPGGGR